jgi:hypothetical protein
MQWIIAIAVVLFLLMTCNSEQSNRAAEEARIQKEVSRRVEYEVALKVADIERKTHIRQAELHTIRVVGFILLAGGSLGGLIWLHRYRAYVPPQPEERQLQMPTWRDHFTLPFNRVLDLQPPAQPASLPSPAPPDAWMDNNTPPRRRRASRRRRRNRNHRNHNYDETPRDS